MKTRSFLLTVPVAISMLTVTSLSARPPAGSGSHAPTAMTAVADRRNLKPCCRHCRLMDRCRRARGRQGGRTPAGTAATAPGAPREADAAEEACCQGAAAAGRAAASSSQGRAAAAQPAAPPQRKPKPHRHRQPRRHLRKPKPRRLRRQPPAPAQAKAAPPPAPPPAPAQAKAAPPPRRHRLSNRRRPRRRPGSGRSTAAAAGTMNVPGMATIKVIPE